jgi:hypothetical protein
MPEKRKNIDQRGALVLCSLTCAKTERPLSTERERTGTNKSDFSKTCVSVLTACALSHYNQMGPIESFGKAM